MDGTRFRTLSIPWRRIVGTAVLAGDAATFWTTASAVAATTATSGSTPNPTPSVSTTASSANWSATTSSVTQPPAGPVPPAITPTSGPPSQPGPDASASSWRSWGTQQRTWIESIPYRQELQAAGFTVTSVAFVAVSHYPDHVAPDGIVTDAAVITGTATSPGSGQVATSTSDPNVCASIAGPGTACIGGSAYNGGTLLSASYTYEGSGTADGHVELAAGCVDGALANGPDQVLAPGQFQEIAYGPVYISGTWSSTWWNLNGSGGYADWGSACASF